MSDDPKLGFQGAVEWIAAPSQPATEMMKMLTEGLIESAIKSACGYDDIMKAGVTESVMVRTFLDDGKVGFEVISRERYLKPSDRS